MRRLRVWIRRLGDAFHMSKREKDLAEEIEANLQLHIDENIRAGMTPQEATRQARIRFGSIESTKEAMRDRRGVPFLDGVRRDVRFALRMLAKSPLFTAVAVLTLGLGIGANTTVFTIAYGAFQGLPFNNADRIVSISEVDRSKPPIDGPASVSQPDLNDIREQSRSFVDFATFGIGTYNISDDASTPERLIGSQVTVNFFSLVGQPPLLGRSFLPVDDQAAEPVVIIGYGTWQTRYAGAADIVNLSVRVDGVPHRIIGVMPRSMRFPVFSEIWLPHKQTSSSGMNRGDRNTEVFARLRDDVSISQAQAELDAIAGRLETEHPQTNRNIDIRVRPYAEQFDNRRNHNATLALIAAVCFVMFIVCANLANMLLARAIDRTRETAIRMAIGASRFQIIRQLLVESMLLSITGGLLGLVLAKLSFDTLIDIAEATGVLARLPFWMTFSFDYHVYLYLAGICLVTGVLFGLAPALQLARTNAGERLKDGAAGSGVNVRSRRLTGLLVTSEIALTFTLLVAAGLMIRSLVRFQTFDADPHTLVSSVVLSGAKYAQPTVRVAFLETLLERLQSTPGLASAAIATRLPGSFTFRDVHTDKAIFSDIPTLVVMPGYFRALGAKVARGRDFTTTDGTPASRVAIVNAQFAAQRWPGEDPIGIRIRMGPQADSPWLTVVGVSGNLQVEDYEEPQGAVYTPYQQEPFGLVVLIACSELPREQVVKALRTTVQAADPDLPLFNVMTMEDHMAQIGLPLRIFVWFFGAFGALALLVSVIGIYGVTAYSVAQRTREIGIRVTLGATSRAVIWLVLGKSVRHLTIGLALGLAGAAGISRALAGMLFRTAPNDVSTYAIVFIAFVAATLAAGLIPVLKTTRIDPATSLKLQ